MKKRIVIAAGGSGGHLLPAQQLARQLIQAHECELFFAGGGLDKSPFFQRDEFSYKSISSSSIRKGFSLVPMGFKILKGFFQSLKILRKTSPHVVVGFGSYHSFPMLLASWVLRKPLVLFEANCLLGKVNRLFAKSAKALAVQFPLKNSSKYSYVPFLPWSEKLKKVDRATAGKSIGLKEDLFTILVFGGSQGAVFINNLALDLARLLKNAGMAFQVLHLTGKSDGEELRAKTFYQKEQIPFLVKSYEKDMSALFSMSDVVIARSGASTIAELLCYQIPSVLIPFPYAADGHQEINARFLEQIGGGVMFLQKEANPKKVAEIVLSMNEKNKKIITDMKAQISQYYTQESKKRSKDISQLVMEIARE